jgi:hypothetical protein
MPDARTHEEKQRRLLEGRGDELGERWIAGSEGVVDDRSGE